MNIEFETVTKNGTTFGLLPLQDIEKLLEDSEMLADIRAYDTAKARLEHGEDEIIPLELIERRLNKENPIKIWREYRELTQEALAKASGISRPMIAAIESGHKTGAATTLKKLATALDVSMEQIV